MLFTLLLLASATLSAQSSGKYLKQLLQPDYTLYFVRPVTLKSAGAAIIVDFTYRHFPTPEQSGPVTINFSLFTREPVRSVETLQLGDDGKPIVTVTPTLLYLEQKKGKWHSRCTAEISLADYLSLLQLGDRFSAVAGSGTLSWRFNADRRWMKSAEVVRTILESELAEKK